MPKHAQSHLNGIFRPRLIPTGSEAASGPGPLLTDMIAHWDLSETSGDRYDSHKDGYTLTDLNGAASAAGVGAGQTAYRAVFADVTKYLLGSHPGSTFSTLDDHFTINLWYKIRSDSGHYLRPLIVTDPVPLDSGGGWGVFRRGPLGTGLQGAFGIRDQTPSSVFLNGTVNPALDEWGMFTAYVNPDNNTLSVWKNDGIVGSNPVALANGGGNSGLTSLIVGYGIDADIQCISIWRGPNAANIVTLDTRTWLYNSGTAARLYSDLYAYQG